MGEGLNPPQTPHIGPLASGQGGPGDTLVATVQKLEDGASQTNTKYNQLRLDLEQLDTNITTIEGTRSGDHIVTLSMGSRSTWRDQQATISRNLIEIDGLNMYYTTSRTSRTA